MTRINGKGPKPKPPPMRLSCVKVERADHQTSALYEVLGGPQDGGALAIVVLHPDGVPVLAIQTLLSADLKTALAESELDPVQAMAMLPPADPDAL